MSLDEMVLMTIQLDTEQRIELAKNCTIKMRDGFKKMGVKQDQLGKKICDFIRLFVSADKKCSRSEYDLINSMYDFDMSYEEFYDLSNGGVQKDFITSMDKYIDSLNADLKYHICLFGLCILVSDDQVTAPEYELFKRILEE